MSYSPEQIKQLHSHTFAHLLVEEKDHVLTLCLNRPEAKNALNPVLMKEIAFGLAYARFQNHIRVVILRGTGSVFCAGADLKAFMGENAPTNSTIPEPEGEILPAELFKQVHKPTIAVVEGDVYAGGFLILANCTWVIAEKNIKLGLPEVKRGLFPFQVMASLMEVMPQRKVLDWCIRGYNLTVEAAAESGLVTEVVEPGNALATAHQLAAEVCRNSPAAIRAGLEAWDNLRSTAPENQHAYLRKMLLQTVQSADAREGITAFKEKRKPVWPE